MKIATTDQKEMNIFQNRVLIGLATVLSSCATV